MGDQDEEGIDLPTLSDLQRSGNSGPHSGAEEEVTGPHSGAEEKVTGKS